MRRSGLDRQRRHRRFGAKIAIVAGLPFLTFALTLLVLNRLFPDYGPDKITAFFLASMVAISLARDLWGARKSTEAWRKGADGEVLTGRALAKLPAAYVCLHDLGMPGSRANIDHLVIGPTGVFTVETKNFSSPVRISGSKATRSGRSMDSVVTQARGQAKAASAALGLPVSPIVCLQGAGLSTGLFSRPSIKSVHFCAGNGLATAIASPKHQLTTDEVERLVVLAKQVLE